nr:protein phosphatase 2C domain-containing protein [Allopontixanthobacter sediminis]
MSKPGYTSVSRTHVGHVRKINEDRILDRSDRGLWAVADGMGGHLGGDVAAEMVISELRALADGMVPVSDQAIKIALDRANEKILEYGEVVGGMVGSTIVGLHIDGDRANLFWAGDSRAYLFQGSRYRQLTKDHSVVQELVDAGAIDQKFAAGHPQANVITRALGVDATLQIDFTLQAIEPGDVFLLCSDGLNSALEGCEKEERDFENDGAMADRILQEALALDGSDNISLVLISIASRGGAI